MSFRQSKTVEIGATPIYIFDNGDSTGMYQAGSNDTMYVKPTANMPAGQGIRFTFDSKEIGRGDTLFFYNDSIINPDRLVSFATAKKVGHCEESVIFGMQAALPNEHGGMTLHFVSNGDWVELPVIVKNSIAATDIDTVRITAYDVQFPYTFYDSIFNVTYSFYTDTDTLYNSSNPYQTETDTLYADFAFTNPKTIWYDCDSAIVLTFDVLLTPPNTDFVSLDLCPSDLPFLYLNSDTTFYEAGTKLIEMPDGSFVVVAVNVNNPENLATANITLQGETTDCYAEGNFVETMIYTNMVADSFYWFSPDRERVWKTNTNSLTINFTPAEMLVIANGRYGVLGKYNDCGFGTDTIWQNLSFFACQDSIAEERIRGDETVCLGDTVTYKIVGGEGITFQWELTGGNFIGSHNTNIVKVIWNTPGEGLLRARYPSQDDGFKLLARCGFICQPFEAKFDSVSMGAFAPNFDEPNIDGFRYINLCPSSSTNYAVTDPVAFEATADYHYNNMYYEQSNTTSRFSWFVGMDQPILDELGRTSYTNYENFKAGYGYTASVRITDNAGCTNSTTCRIRTSRQPISEFVLPPACYDSLYIIKVGYSSVQDSNYIHATPVQLGQESAKVTTERIFLPDGENCPDIGCSYISPATFTAFDAETCISSKEDILYLRLNMEHSYLADFVIYLSCPSGQKVTVMKFGGSPTAACASSIPSSDKGWAASGTSGAFLGYAWDNGASNRCDSTLPDNRAGIGLNYCWSETTNQGYRYGSSNSFTPDISSLIYNNNTFSTTFPPHPSGDSWPSSSSLVRPTNLIERTNFYKPDVSFENLIGCPINGTWNIEVLDGFGQDNGYIFEWELALDPSLLPVPWEYDVEIDTLIMEQINGSPIPQIDIQKDQMIIRPHQVSNNANPFKFDYMIRDEYGCEYENPYGARTLQVNSLPTITGLEDEVFACYGEPIPLEVETDGLSRFTWSNGEFSQSPTAAHQIEVMSSGEYSVTVINEETKCINQATTHVYITPPPDPELESDVEDCKININITPTDCNLVNVSGYKIFRDSIQNMIAENHPRVAGATIDTYIDEEIIDENEHLYWVISRFDDVHIPQLYDICCTDGTYYSREDLPLPAGKIAAGIVYHITDSNYWVMALKNLNAPFQSLRPVWGELNENLGIGDFTEETAVFDFAGKANTDSIIRHNPNLNCAARKSKEFNVRLGFDQTWYLPAYGQMKKIFDNISIINPLIQQLGGTQLFVGNDTLWTSTENNDNEAFGHNGTDIPAAVLKNVKFLGRPVAEMPLVTNISDTILTYVTIYKPIANFIGNSIIDINESTILTATDERVYPSGFATNYSYEWKDPNGITVGTGASLTISGYSTSGTYMYQLTVTLGNGCESTIPVKIIVSPLPVLTGDFIVCKGDTRTYYTDHGKANYVWAVTNGTIEGASDLDSVIVTWNEAGEQTISVHYDEFGVPTITRTMTVNVQNLPNEVIPLSGSGKYCQDDNGLDVIVVNPEIGIWYKLYRNGSVVSNVSAITSIDGSPISFGLQTQAGTYTVKAYTNNPDTPNYDDNTCELFLQDNIIIGITPMPPSRIIYPGNN